MTVELDSLAVDEAAKLLQHIAGGLTDKEAEIIARKCGGVPLLVNLYGSCLECGSLTPEEIFAGPSGLEPVSTVSSNFAVSMASPLFAPFCNVAVLSCSSTPFLIGTEAGCKLALQDADSLLESVIRSLMAVPDKQRPRAVLLSVFPNLITPDAACHVLDISGFEARALIKTLRTHSLLKKVDAPILGSEVYQMELLVRDVSR